MMTKQKFSLVATSVLSINAFVSKREEHVFLRETEFCTGVLKESVK